MPVGIIPLNNRYIVDLAPNPAITRSSGIILVSDKKQDQHVMVVVGIPNRRESDEIEIGDIVRIAASPHAEFEHLEVKDLNGNIFALVWETELGVVVKTKDHYDVQYIVPPKEGAE